MLHVYKDIVLLFMQMMQQPTSPVKSQPQIQPELTSQLQEASILHTGAKFKINQYQPAASDQITSLSPKIWIAIGLMAVCIVTLMVVCAFLLGKMSNGSAQSVHTYRQESQRQKTNSMHTRQGQYQSKIYDSDQKTVKNMPNIKEQNNNNNPSNPEEPPKKNQPETTPKSDKSPKVDKAPKEGKKISQQKKSASKQKSISKSKNNSNQTDGKPTDGKPPANKPKPIASSKPPVFKVPKKLWVYKQLNVSESNSIFLELIAKNHKRLAAQHNVTIHEINEENFKEFVDWQIAANITRLMHQFTSKHYKIKQIFTDQRAVIRSKVLKEVIMSQILLKNGGIVVDRQLLLTESLDWLDKVHDNPYVNRDLRDNGTEVFAFYDLAFSSESFVKNYKTNFNLTKPYRMFKQLPGMTSQLIAALPNAALIYQLSVYLMRILEDPKGQYDKMVNDTSMVHLFKPKTASMHFSYSLTVSAIRLFSQQIKIFNQSDSSGQNTNVSIYDKTFNYFRVSLMNSAYGPTKLQHGMLNYVQLQKRYLTEVSMSQLEAMFGKIDYCAFFPKQIRTQAKFFKKIYNKTTLVSEGSFIQKMIFYQKDPEHVMKSQQIPKTNTRGPIWTALPKKLWLIWDKGFENTSIVKQLMIKNIIKKAKQSGFNTTLVTNQNVHLYLDASTLKRIDFAVANTKFQVYRPLKSNLMRIALIYKHGGVYIDVSVMLVNGLDWLLKIAQMPSNFIWNRFDTLPKILMPYNPWYMNPGDWVVNEVHNTKQASTLGYQNSFIAAIPGSQLLKDWFNMYIMNLVNKYDHTETMLREAGLTSMRMTTPEHTYLIAMQSLRLTVVEKNMQMKQLGVEKYANANHYYGAWYMNMLMGISKYRCFYLNHLDLDDPNCKYNAWLTDYSQQYSQGLIGKVHFYVKMHVEQTQLLNQNLINHFDSMSDLHPKSFVVKHLLAHGERLVKVGDKIQWNFTEKDL